MTGSVPDHSAPFVEKVGALVAKAGGALPLRIQRLIAGRPCPLDGQVLHPEVQLALRLMELDPRPTYEKLDVPEARKLISAQAKAFGGRPSPMAEVRDLEIPGPAGAIGARLYEPAKSSGGLLVYYHGGGWVLCDIDTHDAICRFLAANAKCNVLSVDYRLAPEHKFPAAVDDALAAFRYAARELSDRVALGGDSAGGNLAAVVAQIARDDPPELRPVFQMLFFPVTDLSKKYPSYHLFSEGYFLTEAEMDWYRDHYLANDDQVFDPRVSPMLAEDLSGLAPAYVATAGFDPLRDEGEAYARRMREAGVTVLLRRHEGLVHGFVNAIGVGRSGRAATLEAATVLGSVLW